MALIYLVILIYPLAPDHLRYRLTIEAIVDGRPASAATVVGVDRLWRRRLDLSWDHVTVVDGEAAFLEVPPRSPRQPRNIIVTLISKDPHGRGMAERWPYWGEPTFWNWFDGLGPAHYDWAEAAGWDYPHRPNKMDAKAVSKRISLTGTTEPVLFSIIDPMSGDGLADVDRQLLQARNVIVTDIFVEPTDAPITRGLSKRIPWLETEAARRWHVSIGDLRDLSIFLRHDQLSESER